VRRAIGQTVIRALTAAALMIATPAVVTVAAQANGRITISLGTTTALSTPGGAQIDNGATLITAVTASLINCSHFPCTIFLKTNQAVGFTPTTTATTTATALEYCLTNCATNGTWTAVPNTSGDGDLIATFSTNTSSTFSLRYRLNWTGTFASPPGSYSLPIFVTLKN
jgi:hypothetical protein